MRYLFAFLIAFCSNCVADAPDCSKILEYVQNNLPHCGILKDSDGFIYVDVDNDYIHKLITFIQSQGFEEPPYFGESDLVGAHITVVYPAEMRKYGIEEIQECGQTIWFKPKDCQIVHPPRWRTIDKVYFISVDAPELSRIREKYGLPKKEYEFHITIGVKPKIAEAA